jgi:GntR family transcriptional regulator
MTHKGHPDLPLFLQITESLRHDISSLPPHSRLPSEHELVNTYGVARATVRRALTRLQEEGLTYSRRAVGYFVAEPKIEQDLDRLFSFSEFMVIRGLKPGAKLLAAEILKISSVDSPIRLHLKLGIGERVIHICRLRLGSGRPLVIATTYLPERLFPGFLDHDLKGQSVYQIMQEYGLKPTEATQTFEAAALKRREADLLQVPKDSPALLIERTGYARGTPVEYAVDYYRGDSTKFRVQLADKGNARKLRVHVSGARDKRQTGED